MNEITPTPSGARRWHRAGGLEVAAVILLVISGAAYLVGWFVGVGLLWASPRWRWTDKLVGTLIWPGGLAGLAWAALLVAFPSPPPGAVCDPGIACLLFDSGPPLWAVGAVVVVLALVQIAVAAWLLNRASTPRLQRQTGGPGAPWLTD